MPSHRRLNAADMWYEFVMKRVLFLAGTVFHPFFVIVSPNMHWSATTVYTPPAFMMACGSWSVCPQQHELPPLSAISHSSGSWSVCLQQHEPVPIVAGGC